MKIGIDDAGRGPVIGPMVLAGVLIRDEHEDGLREMGVKDSKKLTTGVRERLAGHILENFGFHVVLTTPEEIDSRTKMGTNLNRIEAVKAAQIINYLMADADETVQVIVDCPSPNTESWGNYLRQHIEKPELVELFVEHKADANHVSCAAASIVAKHHRELEVERIKQELGIDFGSGYCSDPVTMRLLEERFLELKEKGVVRESWDTCNRIKAKREQRSLFEF